MEEEKEIYKPEVRFYPTQEDANNAMARYIEMSCIIKKAQIVYFTNDPEKYDFRYYNMNVKHDWYGNTPGIEITGPFSERVVFAYWFEPENPQCEDDYITRMIEGVYLMSPCEDYKG